MHRIKRAAFVLCLLAALPASARQGEPPRSWETQPMAVSPGIETRAFAPIDAAALRQKDAEAAPKLSGEPTQFAVPFSTAINPARDGEWQILDNGDALWRYGVEVPGATDINLGFTEFRLPLGATLHVWSDEKDPYYQGPYSSRDNKAHRQLWTPVLPGSRVIIELLVPSDAPYQPMIEVGHVGAGYRDFFGHYGGPFLYKQGHCNIDVVCPEGDDWRDQIRSVAVYQLNGRFTCTGSLINDVSQSLTPFFLTAAHCGVNTSSAPSIVVYWNFESPNCGDLSGGSLNDNQSGSTFLASRADVDMALVELDESPMDAFEVFYTGWDRSNLQPGGAVAIHHPGTDEKAISFADSDLLTTSSCIGHSTPSTHWEVPFWDLGTTEPGSSGSGIWHPTNKRLVGFLSGGTASCFNTSGYDCYGKFAVAWDGDSASSRLRDWLDPDGLEPDGVDGTDPSGFQIIPDARSASLCLPGDIGFQLDIPQSGDFDETVTLSVAGLPSSFSATFSNQVLVPPGQSSLTIGNLSVGHHAFRVVGQSSSMQRELHLEMVVADGLPSVPDLTSPIDGAIDIPTSPVMEWNEADQAVQYEVEIAPDVSFGNVFYSSITSDSSHQVRATLSPDSQFFARVRAINDCGEGDWSDATQFTTALEICATPNIPIPDDAPSGIESVMTVEAAMDIDTLQVALDIPHTWVGDLIVDLEHVNSGTTVRLFERPGVGSSGGFGCSGSNLDVILDDDASLSIQDECSSSGQAYAAGGVYRPYEQLSGFQGVSLQGDWRLSVSDHAGADVGTLAKWCLTPTLQGSGYTISVFAYPEEGGTVHGGGVFEHDESVTVTAEPNDGFGFESWTDGVQEVSSSSIYEFSATGSRTLTANFGRIGLSMSMLSTEARAGDEVELAVQVATVGGVPHAETVDLCLMAQHRGGGEVEISAGDLIGPGSGDEGAVCGSTDEDGRATFNLMTTKVGAVEAIAHSDSLGSSEPLEIVFEAGEPHRLVLESEEEATTACDEVEVLMSLEDAYENPIVGMEASALEVTISLSSLHGSPEIIDSGLESINSVEEHAVTGTMPSSGSATILVTLDVSGELEIEASSEMLAQAPTEPAMESVVFEAGGLDSALSEISSSTSQIYSGQGEARILIVPRDTCNVMMGAGQDVRLEASFGSLSQLVDNHDGTYSSHFTTVRGDCPAEPALITAVVNDVDLDSVVEISSLCGDIDESSTVTVDHDAVETCPASGSFALITVLPRDVNGEALPSGQDVRVTEDAPRVVSGDTREEVDFDTGEPIYFIEVGSNRCADGQRVAIEVQVGGVTMNTRPAIEFICPPIVSGGVDFSAQPAEVPADGESTSAVRLEVSDSCGNPAFGRAVLLEALGDLPAVISEDEVTTVDAFGHLDDGTATVELSSTEPGIVGLKAVIEGEAHESAEDLVTFIKTDEQPDDSSAKEGCGCAAGANDSSTASGVLILLALMAFLRGSGPRKLREDGYGPWAK